MFQAVAGRKVSILGICKLEIFLGKFDTGLSGDVLRFPSKARKALERDIPLTTVDVEIQGLKYSGFSDALNMTG